MRGVSSGDNILNMATKYVWGPPDHATQQTLGSLIKKSGYSYRQFESLLNGQISYSRVRDIELGRRAPAKMSEFLAICEICHADPVEKLREIIRLTHQIEAERTQTGTSDEVDIDSWANRIRSEESVPQGE